MEQCEEVAYRAAYPAIACVLEGCDSKGYSVPDLVCSHQDEEGQDLQHPPADVVAALVVGLQLCK